MFKPNAVITLVYDSKNNTVYKIDVTTRKIYSNFSDLRIAKSNTLAAIIVILATTITRMIANIRPDLYLNVTLQYLKFPFMLVGILIGFLMFSLIQRIRYGLQLDKYLKQIPPPKEIHNIDAVLDKAHSTAKLTVVIALGFLLASIYMWNQFFNDGNLISYFWALIWFIYFSGFSALLKGAKFIVKLAAEMSPKEVNEITTPKKHPWDEENQDENEIWRAKMLKIESEMNSSKE